jgi:hypothetical protein
MSSFRINPSTKSSSGIDFHSKFERYYVKLGRSCWRNLDGQLEPMGPVEVLRLASTHRDKIELAMFPAAMDSFRNNTNLMEKHQIW